MKKKIEVEFTISPLEAATAFCQMSEIEQADFFNHIAKDVVSWPMAFDFQMSRVEIAANLSNEARAIMKCIGDYAGQANSKPAENQKWDIIGVSQVAALHKLNGADYEAVLNIIRNSYDVITEDMVKQLLLDTLPF